MKIQLLPNTEFTKEEFLEILEKTLHKIKTNQTNFPRIGKYLIFFLYKHQNTKTFEEFFNMFVFTKLNLINSEVQDYQYYLKSDIPWQTIFEEITEKEEIGFIETWIEEEDRELFYQFLEKEHNVILIPQEQRFLKAIEKYMAKTEKLRKYPFYWQKENAHQRFFDKYIAFVYTNPNSKTAQKLLKIFDKEGNMFIENLKSQINNNNYLQAIKNLINKEELDTFTTFLKRKVIQKINKQISMTI
jgi:hypothetical protein